jgi:hypothetical protein
VIIPERQAALDAFVQKYLISPESKPNDGVGHRLPLGGSDEEIIALCRKAKNAAKFSALYDGGDTSLHNNDDSRADMSLIDLMAFYTQDIDQLDRLFSNSALAQRSKSKSRPDYRRGTINKVLKDQGETYTPARSHSHSLSSLGMGNEPEPKIQAFSFSGREKPAPRGWIVDNTIWSGHATSWFGEGGVAKSLLALHLGLTVAAESRSYWMAFAVKTVPVLYLDFELDADEQHRRVLDLAKGMRLGTIPENFYYLSVAMLPPAQAFRIAAEECRRLGIKLVIVDSVGFALDGDSENSRDVLGFYRERIQPLKDAGASPLLIDHQAKIIKGEKYSDKQAFGSVYKTNAVRSSFQIRGSHEQGELTATFAHKKNNFGCKEKDFSLNIVFEEGRITVERLDAATPNPDREPSKKELVLEAIEELGRTTAEAVTERTGIAKKTVQNSISELLTEGALQDTGDKQNRSRIVVPPSHTTKGMGMGTNLDQSFRLPTPNHTTKGTAAEAQAVTRPLEEHPSACLCEACLPI